MIRTQNIRMKWHVLVGIHKPLILYLIRNAKIESTFSAIQQILPGVQLKQASLSLCVWVYVCLRNGYVSIIRAMLFYVACKNVNPLHTHTNTLHLFLLTRAHTSKCVTWFWILDVVVAVAPHSGLLQISRYPFSSYFSCSLQTLITTEILA